MKGEAMGWSSIWSSIRSSILVQGKYLAIKNITVPYRLGMVPVFSGKYKCSLQIFLRRHTIEVHYISRKCVKQFIW